LLRPPYLQEVRFVFVGNDVPAITQFKGRTVDGFFSGNPDYDRFRDSLNLTTRRFSEREFEFIAFNTQRELLQRPVRAAISRMIDREALVNDVLNGNGMVADFPVQPESWLLEMWPTMISYDVESARAMLEGAGFRWNFDVFSRPTNRGEMPLVFDLLVNSQRVDSVRIAEGIARQLRPHGVRINVVRLEHSEKMSRIANGNFDMAIAGLRVKTYPDMSIMFSPSSYHDFDVNLNIANYGNDEVDRLVRELFTDIDVTGRQNTFAELAEIIRGDAPYFGLYFRTSTVFFRNNIKGFERPHVWSPFGGIRNWYLAEHF